MVPFTHAAFFVVKNRAIKRGLEQKNCVIKKSRRIRLMCVMALTSRQNVSYLGKVNWFVICGLYMELT